MLYIKEVVSLQSFIMQQLIKQILLIISAIMLVIASGGISLYQHYCSCEGELNNSIIVEMANCHESSEVQSCCTIPAEEVVSCCQSEANQNTNHSHCGDNENCCNSEVSFLKTDEFNYSFENKKSFQFIVAFVNIIDPVYLQNVKDFTKETNFFSDLPPPNFGKYFLIQHHQLKIAPPIA